MWTRRVPRWRRLGTGPSRRQCATCKPSWDWFIDRKFVHEFAEIARPLTDILKSTEFEEKFGRAFSNKAPVGFKNLKQALISIQCLVIFDPTAFREWRTVWAVLMQDHRCGLEHVSVDGC